MPESKTEISRQGDGFPPSNLETARYRLWRGAIYFLAVVVPLLVL
jgi:hypothetical protein